MIIRVSSESAKESITTPQISWAVASMSLDPPTHRLVERDARRVATDLAALLKELVLDWEDEMVYGNLLELTTNLIQSSQELDHLTKSCSKRLEDCKNASGKELPFVNGRICLVNMEKHRLSSTPSEHNSNDPFHKLQLDCINEKLQRIDATQELLELATGKPMVGILQSQDYFRRKEIKAKRSSVTATIKALRRHRKKICELVAIFPPEVLVRHLEKDRAVLPEHVIKASGSASLSNLI
jgi:hypothetical protein